MSTLSLEHVSFTYASGTPFCKEALHDVTFTLPENKITGVVGHTGSGKSTMLELLSGLLRPTEGRVLIDGVDIHLKPEQMACDRLIAAGLSSAAVRRHRFFKTALWREKKKECAEQIRARRFLVGHVMQYPEYQLFDDTVLSDIGFGPRNMGMTKEEADERSRQAARLVDLREELLARSPFDLSGGEKRRVAIAGILAMQPQILILDEPAAGLDPVGKTRIFECISDYNKKTGATVLLVSHSMEDLAQYCDEVIVISEGRLFRQGTIDDVFSRPAELRQLGLDVPQITDIASRLIDAGVPLSGNLFTVDGVEEAILACLRGGAAS